jgi:hypothetical protein
MSNKVLDKGKLFHKIHQLQKRLTRSEQNEGHSDNKIIFRKSLIKKLQEKIYGKNKPK